MVAEDLKLKQINSIQVTSQLNGGSQSSVTNSTIENVFKAFKKFAEQRGVTLKAEDFQAVVNSHPEIFEMSAEKQADAIVKVLVAKDKNSNITTAAPTEVEEAKAETTPFSFAALTKEDQAQLENEIKLMLESQTIERQDDMAVNDTESELTALALEYERNTPPSDIKTDDNKTNANLKEELNVTLTKETVPRIQKQEAKPVSAKAQHAEAQNKKDPEAQYIKEYAKNLYLFGQEKHTEEEWNNLSETEKAQFIKNNNIEQLAKETLKDTDSAFNLFGLKNNNIPEAKTKETILNSKLLALQAANAKGITFKEFKSLSLMEQGVAMIDIIAAKDPNTLTTLEKLALEEAKILKDAVIHKFKSLQEDETNIELIEKMSYGELYGTLQKANKTDCLAIYLKNYLQEKDPSTFTEYEKYTYDIIKDLPVYAISGFGTAPGISAIETEILNNEEYKTQYLNADNPSKQAEIKAEYFYKQYGDDPEKFMAAFQDAIKHGNIIEVKALMSLVETNKLEKTKAFLEEAQKNDCNILIFSKSGGFINKTLNYTLELTKKLEEAYKTNKVSAAEVTQEARKLVNENPEELAEVAQKLPELNEHIATGIVKGTQDVGQAGKLTGEAAAAVGAAVAKCSEKVQDAGIELAGDRTIDSKVRAQFANPLFQNSGYAALKGIEKHIPKTFDDNSEAQSEVFSSIKQGVETHCPKKVAVKALQNLNTQLSELNEDIQAEMFQTMLDSKYEEVAIHTATIIHTLNEKAQAKALQAAYNSGKVEIIEAATLQVDKMAKPAVEQMKEEIKRQIIAMEDRHAFSALEEFALRQLKKMFGFGADTSTPEFKTRLEAYIAELKSLPKSEVYLRICNDIQSWPSDKQALVLEAIAKYCPILFSMMLDKYGTKLLSSFGQINSTTKNTILSQMLKTPSQRSEAIAYIQANPNGNYSDNLKQLYNEILDELVKSGTLAEESVSSDNLRKPSYQSVPADFSSQNSIVTIGQKYNWNMSSDVDGNIGLIS